MQLFASYLKVVTDTFLVYNYLKKSLRGLGFKIDFVLRFSFYIFLLHPESYCQIYFSIP